MMLECQNRRPLSKVTLFGGFAWYDAAFTWEIKDYSFVTVSQSSPDSQQTDLDP